MWNLMSCNKITEQKMRKESYEKHTDAVNKMKSKIKITEPEHPWFIYAKKKKQMAINQQMKGIDRNNQLLLAKIQSIQKRSNSTYKRPSFLTTLNSKVMKDMSNQIFKENKRICDKIMHTETFYKTKTILEKSSNLEKVLSNISLNARRVQSAKSLALSTNKIFRPVSGSARRPKSSCVKSLPISDFLLKFKSSRKEARPKSAYSTKNFKSSYSEKKKAEDEEAIATQN